MAEREPTSDSVDLSSASVFENSYSDLDQILSGHGSTAPIPTDLPQKKRAEPSGGSFSSTTSIPTGKTKLSNSQPVSSYGSTGMTIGFLMAVVSSSIGIWFTLLVLKSRFSVLESQPLSGVSQTLHDVSHASFNSLQISPALENSFVALGWVIWIAAACLLAMVIGQSINAFAKLFRRRHLLPGIDGVTGLTAILLLFLLTGTIFFHFSHMSQLNRDLVQKAGGHIDETTVLGQNLLKVRAEHSTHSRQFLNNMVFAASVPLCVCILSLCRVYITLGEPDFTQSRHENP